ncbi:MAG TPA: isoprenylcysteine carboxylmethyltransferase family protein [Xanthobacteraceae bacterium]|nr:isoprenylcysteine carboxylmethyltransferase family protein [Xanthobacteraceae bacterium]
MSDRVLILAAGTILLGLVFGIRIGSRALSGGSGAAPTAGAQAPDVAGVVAQPPYIFLAFLAGATVLEALVPLPVAAAYPVARYVAGAALIAAALAIVFAAGARFHAAGTNIPPSLPTTALVVEGVYAWTRNPFYLGAVLVFGGLAVAAGSLWAVLLLVPFVWVINVGVIAREERYLERRFGDAYRAYKARVRRWL